jgi:hypothetical protein
MLGTSFQIILLFSNASYSDRCSNGFISLAVFNQIGNFG